MSNSLADQTHYLAVALGANQVGPGGLPRQTFAAVRPLLEGVIKAWAQPASAENLRSSLNFSWSSDYETAPVGGPADQPPYLNAVLLVKGVGVSPGLEQALILLDEFQKLENSFGRDRSREKRWGPRPMDLDWLFWGELRIDHARLILPHPRLHLRSFVLEPLLDVMKR